VIKLKYLGELFSYFKYILLLSLSRHKGIYFLIVGIVLSVIVEFLAIYIVSLEVNSPVINLFGYQFILDSENIPLYFIGLLTIRFISLFSIESYTQYYTKEMQVYFSSFSLEKIMNTNIKRIEKKQIGHYISFAGDEASNAAQVIVSFINILSSLVLITAYLVLIINHSIDLIYFTVFIFIFILVTFKIIFKYIFKLGVLQAELRRKNNSVFMDSFNGIRVIKALSLEGYMSNEYKKVCDRYFTVNYKLVVFGSLSKYAPLVIVMSFFALYYIYFLKNGSLISIGTILASLFILLRLLHSVGDLASIVGKLIGDLKGTKHLMDFLNEDTFDNKKNKISQKVSAIVIKNLSFSYNKNVIFDNLNITFKRGESYAIIGKTGSGKSSLLDLIMDYNAPSKGGVYVNNIINTELNNESMANKILYVGQDSIIFNDTILKNLTINKNYTDAEIRKSLQLTDLNETIKSFEFGLNQILQYRGTNISGGQKQRLNISRAILRNPDVLILDESVNALDSATRERVIKNLILEYKDKIIIFVTHDKDILNLVTKVINLDQINGQECKKTIINRCCVTSL
jgi:ABC-type multidrug transport system fused ATPase/permease subunit